MAFTRLRLIATNMSPVIKLSGSRQLSVSARLANSGEILTEVHGSTGLITLNRPKVLNALNLTMIREMHPVITEWEQDPNINMIVMKGAGGKAFCAGGDVVSVAKHVKLGGELPRVFFKEEYQLNHTLGSLQTPMVALISGITMGGGVGLSVHGHYRVCSEKTLFAMPETAIGLFPDVGGGHFLPKLQGKLGLFLSLTGHRLKGQDVYHAGVATHFASLAETEALENALLTLDKPTHETVQQTLSEFHSKSFNASQPFSLTVDDIARIDRVFSAATLEGIVQNLESDGSEWASKLVTTLGKMCPMSMKATMRQLEQGALMDLAETLKMEYRLSQRFMESGDFVEGIRALLVDKDGSPSWQHARIEDVTDEQVDQFFSKLDEDRELVL